MVAQILEYGANGFVLLIPVLLWNVALASELPPGYSKPELWDAIPRALAVAENGLRAAVFALPLVMRIGVSSRRQRAGLIVYAVGLVAYGASWMAEIWLPASAWSRSAAGFMAPAYTAAIWLVGIGMVGERLHRNLPYHPNAYFVFCGAFIVVHTAHAWLVFGKT
jgi:hypothetical protein